MGTRSTYIAYIICFVVCFIKQISPLLTHDDDEVRDKRVTTCRPGRGVVCMHISMMQNLGGLLGDSANERPRHEVMERVLVHIGEDQHVQNAKRVYG